jgi:histone H3/H4
MEENTIEKINTIEKFKKKNRFFELYICKLLKQISNKNGINSNAKQQLNSTICIMASYISNLIFKLTEIAKKKTISIKEVINAVKIIFPIKLANKCIIEGYKSIKNFTNKKLVKGGSRQGKAGIVFPPSIIEKFLRNFGYSKIMITSSSPVFFATILEYFASELLSLSINFANTNKRIRITIRDLELGVRHNKEISDVFNKLNIFFIGGGVIPYIHSSLITTKKRKKKGLETTKKYRFRYGTVAIREIKKLQKTSDCLTFAKFPFERLVRNIVNKTNNGMKISKDVFIILQYHVEQYMIKFLKHANLAAIHASRVKLMPVDLQFIRTINDITNSKEDCLKEDCSNEDCSKEDCSKEDCLKEDCLKEDCLKEDCLSTSDKM